MDSSIYIPKWLIAAFLAAVGCVVGWMFGAADLVTASIGRPRPRRTAPTLRRSTWSPPRLPRPSAWPMPRRPLP